MFALMTLFFIGLIIFAGFKLITGKKDYGKLECGSSTDVLIYTLVNEINTAISLDKNYVVHKFNHTEPLIDGEVVANVTFSVAMSTPCVISFRYEENGDVKISLDVMKKMIN